MSESITSRPAPPEPSPGERSALELSGKQKKYLRGLAHGLKPLAHVGRQGLSDAFLEELDQSLTHHELVKVKFLDWKDERKALSQEMADRLGCALAGGVGHHAILYRPAPEPADRRIRLPRPAENA